jgi:hypothetical protein
LSIFVASGKQRSRDRNPGVLSSAVVLGVDVKLVDTRTGTLLWEGRGAPAAAKRRKSKNGSAHQVGWRANTMMSPNNTGLPFWPYSRCRKG